MAITIKRVSRKKELKKFIRFNYEMYKGNPYSVPDLFDDMLNTFNKKKNAAFEFCEAEYFLAYKDNKLVGRVASGNQICSGNIALFPAPPTNINPRANGSIAAPPLTSDTVSGVKPNVPP